MFKMIHYIILFCFLGVFLTACQTFSSSEKKHDRKATAANINIQLGMAYLEKHEIRRAKQKFLLALHEAPQLPEAWYSLAYFFEVTGDTLRAERCYLHSIELAPNRGDTNNNYGTFLCRTHHYSAAIQRFLAATQDVEYLDTAAAYENAGLCAELIPSPALAKRYFTEALKQDPHRPLALLSMAELNYKQDNYEEAKHFLRQFLIESPPTAESRALSAKLRDI